MIRTLPLGLRNRLAATILEAVDDAGARRALAALAEAPDAWLAVDERQWAALLAVRARRASEALGAMPPSSARGVDGALEAAARIPDARYGAIEVHEVMALEAPPGMGGPQ